MSNASLAIKKPNLQCLDLVFNKTVKYLFNMNFMLCFQQTNVSVFLLNFQSSGNAATCNLVAHLYLVHKKSYLGSFLRTVFQDGWKNACPWYLPPL